MLNNKVFNKTHNNKNRSKQNLLLNHLNKILKLNQLFKKKKNLNKIFKLLLRKLRVIMSNQLYNKNNLNQLKIKLYK